jgi:hypothetical protein
MLKNHLGREIKVGTMRRTSKQEEGENPVEMECDVRNFK